MGSFADTNSCWMEEKVLAFGNECYVSLFFFYDDDDEGKSWQDVRIGEREMEREEMGRERFTYKDFLPAIRG